MSQEEFHGKHEKAAEPAKPMGYWADFRDSVSPRTVLLVIGVLALQIAFIWSYVGAFHNPSPHRIAVVVAVPGAPHPTQQQLVTRLNAISGEPLQATAVGSAAQARQRLIDGTDYAALVVDATGTKDTLLTASALGTSTVTAATRVFTQVETAEHRQLTVTDIVPLQNEDYNGLTGFYLVIGWLVGGYLVASLLGIAKGSRPSTLRRARLRLGVMAVYSIVGGLGGAIIVDPILGAMTGHFLALWWLGALIIASAATVTMALQILFGIVGIGVTVLIFVVLGNPSATGAYQAPMLPTFWRTIAYWLPNGAGVDTVRRILYFGGNGILGHLIVICAWIVGGAIVALVAAYLTHHRTAKSSQPDSEHDVQLA